MLAKGVSDDTKPRRWGLTRNLLGRKKKHLERRGHNGALGDGREQLGHGGDTGGEQVRHGGGGVPRGRMGGGAGHVCAD